MKILVVSQYFYPENFRINDLCFALVERGHHVTVLTGYPNYPNGYIYPEYKGRKDKHEYIRGVEVLRVRISQRRKNPISLFFNYFTYAFFASCEVKRLDQDYDIVYVFEVSPITQIIPAWRYKRKKNDTALVVNCQDIWPDVVKVYGIHENSFLFSIIRAFSARLYNRSDLILNSSPGFAEYLHKICSVPNEKMRFFPNFAEDFYLEFGSKPVMDGKMHFLFAGNIGKAQSLDTVVKCVEILKSDLKQKITVDILGDGSYLNELKTLVRDKHLEGCFIFHGRKSLEQLRVYYEMADCFLLTLDGSSSLSNTIPAKLQGYMGAGKQILAAINGGSSKIIQEANCGICVPAGDFWALAESMRDMIECPEKYRDCGMNGRRYFREHFQKSIFVDRLLYEFEQLIGEK